MANLNSDSDALVRAFATVTVSTVVLTAGFVGLLALVSGRLGDVGGRFPWYVLAMGIAFVTVIFLLANRGADPETALVASTGVGILTLVGTFFAVEGVVYAVSQPEEVFRSQLLVYLLAAALVATGLTFWLLRYWRSLTTFAPDTPGRR